ncbi:MAG: BrnT family toxin [Rhodobacteraceae bacterium]|nr:BrnT family toxin [Paracoccaceae bacterium]
MKIEFDPNKNALNKKKHGLSLAEGRELFDDLNHLILPSNRPMDGEERFKIIGIKDGRFCTAVYTERGAAIRFISVRRGNSGEQRLYRAAS